MRWSIGRKLASAFGVALAMILIVGAVSHDSAARLIASAEWVRQSHQVVTGLDEFLSAMKDAETGQRGYVITGETRYLEPYQGAHELADQKLKQVRELTSDNPNQQQRLTALEPLVAGKFAELQETIDLRRTRGFDVASRWLSRIEARMRWTPFASWLATWTRRDEPFAGRTVSNNDRAISNSQDGDSEIDGLFLRRDLSGS